MILYFSGTGNSEYAAKRIGKGIDEDAVNLFEKIKNRDFKSMHSDSPWIITAPTYAWRIPRILNEWLEKTTLSGSRDIYFAMTCGGNIGNSEKYLKKLCDSKNMNYKGCAPIVMPENYIAMFTTPEKEEALNTIFQAEAKIDKVIATIKNKKAFEPPSLTMKDRINSSIINDIFYPLFVHSKKFYVKDSCISCQKCESLCPLNNIHIENRKPVWGNSCTHCMACICCCPVNAIEYGEHSKGMARYTCPK